MESTYLKYSLNMFMLGFVLLSVFNSTLTHFGYNLIKLLSELLKNKFNFSLNLEKIIYLIAGVFGVLIAINRNYWLPFLGESVLPSNLIPLHSNNGDTTIKVNVKPNVKIAYWSSKPSNKKLKVDKAYDDYSNSGVVMSDKNGVAILTLNKGVGYFVPSGKYIKSHVHFRELNGDYGMIGPIKTYYL